MTKANITKSDVAKIAKLANLTITPDEEGLFADQFSQTIDVVDQLNEIDTKGLPPTSQVTHLENVTRPDEVDKDRILTQAEALSGAKKTHKGFFVVKQILEKDSE
ncbi:Asp-tRNA(Asn)/Glu-tRNA(Gln) amidotransferase subunit GatC [Candidatus Collierbacteria bacterium]|nr:Asp-tRNA(Asn)/Glu-tRNA(Gln) amidotransferase subunit GatC [Candidatus Collierbacteria bacterium]